MRAIQSSLSYPMKANFRNEITKVRVHRNVQVPAGTFGQGKINWSRMNRSVLYEHLLCSSAIAVIVKIQDLVCTAYFTKFLCP